MPLVARRTLYTKQVTLHVHSWHEKDTRVKVSLKSPSKTISGPVLDNAHSQVQKAKKKQAGLLRSMCGASSLCSRTTCSSWPMSANSCWKASRLENCGANGSESSELRQPEGVCVYRKLRKSSPQKVGKKAGCNEAVSRRTRVVGNRTAGHSDCVQHDAARMTT